MECEQGACVARPAELRAAGEAGSALAAAAQSDRAPLPPSFRAMTGIIRKTDVVNALGGGQGGLIALLVTLPIESVQKMQCTAAGRTPTVAECCRAIYGKGGITNFWRGTPPLVLQAFVEKFCYFLPYSVLVFYYEQRYGRMGYLANLLIGYFAELIRIPFNYPIEVVATYSQVRLWYRLPSRAER